STPSTILCSVRRCPAGICAFCAGPTLLIFFRVPCFGDHRYLPSFPTRRSSDLIPLSQVIDFLSFSDCQLTNCPKADSPFPIAMGDRKSTRLNSSHVKISYAVFCLKKKTTPSRQSDYLPRQAEAPPSRRPGAGTG